LSNLVSSDGHIEERENFRVVKDFIRLVGSIEEGIDDVISAEELEVFACRVSFSDSNGCEWRWYIILRIVKSSVDFTANITSSVYIWFGYK